MNTCDDIALDLYDGGTSVKVITERIREAREDIREECAKLCESMNDSYAHELARLIRQIEIP
jgi:hypothetical protein